MVGADERGAGEGSPAQDCALQAADPGGMASQGRLPGHAGSYGQQQGSTHPPDVQDAVSEPVHQVQSRRPQGALPSLETLPLRRDQEPRQDLQPAEADTGQESHRRLQNALLLRHPPRRRQRGVLVGRPSHVMVRHGPLDQAVQDAPLQQHRPPVDLDAQEAAALRSRRRGWGGLRVPRDGVPGPDAESLHRAPQAPPRSQVRQVRRRAGCDFPSDTAVALHVRGRPDRAHVHGEMTCSRRSCRPAPYFQPHAWRR
mmetsp:Transcript_56408/g.132116  ORF Transcript_56408/g.132116 Transcript_56408/m.132116 type:complete len:256 (+) Transcript_56408:469-1236(+)